MKKKYPRRAVTQHFERRGFFHCTLICGHTQMAYGRKDEHGVPQAPKTVECRACEPK